MCPARDWDVLSGKHHLRVTTSGSNVAGLKSPLDVDMLAQVIFASNVAAAASRPLGKNRITVDMVEEKLQSRN